MAAAYAIGSAPKRNARTRRKNPGKTVNNFYFLQLLKDGTTGRYYVQTCPVTEVLSYGVNLAQVKTVFSGRFYKKTGFRWSERHTCSQTSGKCQLLKTNDMSPEDSKTLEFILDATEEVGLHGNPHAQLGPYNAVYKEGTTDWDCILHHNVSSRKKKMDHFCIIQLLQGETSDMFCARILYIQSIQLKQHSKTLGSAQDEFVAKCTTRIKNGWTEMDLQAMTGSVTRRVFQYIPATKSKQNQKVEGSVTRRVFQYIPATKSKQNQKVEELMALIFNLDTMEKVAVQMGFDKDRLGCLDKYMIKEGWKALTKIQNLMNDPDAMTDSKMDCAWAEYYKIIPHKEIRHAHIRGIEMHEEKLKDKIELQKVLRNIRKAKKLKAGAEAGNAINSLYRQLNCTLTPLEKGHRMYELVREYLEQTQGPTHKKYALQLMEVFECTKAQTFVDKGNRVLLWHGSRLSNWPRILASGLKIAPPHTPKTGYMFGKGVYFADISSKSANYCKPTRENDIGLLLLCDVSLGDFCERTRADPNHDTTSSPCSVKGLGTWTPDPKGTVTIKDGVKVPLGAPIRTHINSALDYNEYVVYDKWQISMEYLVMVKFNFKSPYN